MAEDKLKITYAELETNKPNFYQPVLLIEENKKKYGIVGCPSKGFFIRLPENEIEDFSNLVNESSPRILIPDDQRRNYFSDLVKRILETSEYSFINPGTVNSILDYFK